MDPRFKTSEPIILYTRRKKKKMSSCNVEALTMERFTAHCPFIFLLFIIQMEGRTRRRDRKGRKVLREGDVSERPPDLWIQLLVLSYDYATFSYLSSTSYLQIFLLMLGNNSKDGKVMWEMNVGRDKIIKKSLTKRWKLKR